MTVDDPRIHEVRRRSQDPRARDTRARLVRAYVDLSRSAHAVPSISQIVRSAGVNRSSFYAHFTSVGDLSLYVLQSALVSIYAGSTEALRSRGQEGLAVTTASMMINAVEENRSALRAAVLNDRALARRQIGLAIEGSTLELLHALPGWENASQGRLRLLVIYLSHGWSAVLCGWLAGELELTRDQLLHELLALNPDGVRYLGAQADLTSRPED